VFVWQQATLNNVTVTGNQSGSQGGGLAAAEGASVTVRNSVISGNTGGDCLGPITSGGHNIAGDSTCAFSAAGDLNSTEPLLGPLLPDGDTHIHPLLAGSPAVDSGDGAFCPDADQRGVTRPQGSSCDRGAYEVIPADIGDVDCSGQRTTLDVLALVKALAEVEGADCLSAADVNGDHAVNAQDIIAVLSLL
jgi:predicted outer membrane repeat protein